MALLPEAIESCYKTFSDVLKPREIPGCPCCIESIHPQTLLSKRLRDLSASDLFSYHAAVFNTVGDTTDFFYFLPRLLELSSQFPNTDLSPEILGRALATTQITTWRKDRLEALMDFLNAIFLNLLEQEESGDAINSWLCAVCKMGLDPKPFLSIQEEMVDLAGGQIGVPYGTRKWSVLPSETSLSLLLFVCTLSSLPPSSNLLACPSVFFNQTHRPGKNVPPWSYRRFYS